MPRKKKNEENKVPSINYAAPSDAYSASSLESLKSGHYKEDRAKAVADYRVKEAQKKRAELVNEYNNSRVPELKTSSNNINNVNNNPNYVMVQTDFGVLPVNASSQSPLLAKPSMANMTLQDLSNMKASQATRPATRYRNEPVAKQQKVSATPRNEQPYDKEFAEYFDYRYNFPDVPDWDEATQTETPHHENIKKDMMKKYGWSEKQFEEKWKDYSNAEWNRQSAQELQSNIDIAENHPALATAVQAAYLPQSMIEGVAGTTSRIFGAEPEVDDLVGTRSREAIKTIVSDKLGTGGKIAYNAGTGLTDMMLAKGIPVAGTAALGAEAAARSLVNSEERGVDNRLAGWQALLTGANSAVANKVGLDKALEPVKGVTAVGQVAKGALVEGAENAVEDSVNLLIDTVFNGRKGELISLHDYYKGKGMSSAEAWAQVGKDKGLDLLTSIASGAAFGGGLSALGNLPRLKSEIKDLVSYKKNPNSNIQSIIDGMGADVLENAKAQQQQTAKAIQEQITPENVISATEQAVKNEVKEKITKPTVIPPKEEVAETPINSGLAKNEGKIPAQDVISPQVEPSTYDVDSIVGNDGKEKFLIVETKPDGTEDFAENGKYYDTEEDALRAIDDLTKAQSAPAEVSNTQGATSTQAELQEINDYVNQEQQLNNRVPRTAGESAPVDRKAQLAELTSEIEKKRAQLNKIPKKNKNKRQKVYDELQELQARAVELLRGRGEDASNIIEMEEPTPRVALNDTGIRRASADIREHAETPTDYDTSDFILEEELPAGEGYVEDGLSRVLTKSAVNAGIIDKKLLDTNPELRKIAAYQRASNDKSFRDASENVRNNPKLLQEYADGREVKSFQDVDECMIMAQNIKDQLDEATDPQRIAELTASRNMLLSRLRKAGTESGQLIQAFAKWNDTADGAMLNGERIRAERVNQFLNNNKKVKENNSRIAKALAKMGDDTKQRYSETTPKSHEEIRKGVIAELEKEYGSIRDNFNEDDIEYLTYLAENTDIPIWQIVDEIEHRMETGHWYTLDESIEPNRPLNQRLMGALNSLLDRPEAAAAPEFTLDEIKEQVRNTLERESASIGDFTEDDVNYLASLIKNGAKVDDIADALNQKIATGSFGIKAETQQTVNELFRYAEYVGVNSKEGVEAKLAAYKLIANETVGKASGFEKFEAWRYLAMLGNTKTMVRNRVGNTMFNIITGFSNNLSAMLEAGIDKTGKAIGNTEFGRKHNISGIDRTKSVLNPLGFLESTVSTAQKSAGNKALNLAKMALGVNNLDDVNIEDAPKPIANLIKTGKNLNAKSESTLKNNDAKLISASRNDGQQNMWSEISGQNSKYEKSTRDKIKSQKSVFDSKIMQLYEKLTDAGISDTSAVLRKYSTSLAGYLKANGYDASAFDAEPRYNNLKAEARHRMLTDAERAEMEELKKTMDFLDKARLYAVDQADYATFHEDNAVASWLNKMSQNAPGPIGVAIEGTFPFKKTPANILKSGFEYSPFGAIKSFKDTAQLWYENSGKRKGNKAETYERNKILGKGTKTVKRITASDVIDSWSKTLTGSALAVLGYWLAEKGVLHSSKGGEKYQDQLEGKQNYALNVNGHSYTLDWGAPASMPLLVGAEWQKITEQNGISSKSWMENIDQAVGTINALLDPMVETSMMQGARDSLESAARQFRNEENDALGKGGGVAGALLSGAATNFLSQGVPTVLGQIARTVDPTRRSTDTITDSNFLGEFERTGRRVLNKIPGLSYINQPYINARGETEQNSPFESNGVLPVLGNLLYQTLSPSYFDNIVETDADKMSRGVYNAEVFDEKTQTNKPIMDSNVFAPWKSTVRVNGEKLNPEQMADYRVRSGQADNQIRTALANEDWFKQLPPAQQKSILTSLRTLDDKIGKAPYDPSVAGDDYDAFVNGGVAGAVEYYKEKAIKKQIKEETGLNSNSNEFKDIVNNVLEGNTEVANQQIAEAAKQQEAVKPYEEPAKVLGIDAKDYSNIKNYAGDSWGKVESELPKLKGMGVTNYSQYAHAVKYADTNNESVDMNWFVNQTKLLDTDKSGGISQDELVDYFNEHGMSEQEVNRLWGMLALGKDGAEPKSIPHILTRGKNKGKWGK